MKATIDISRYDAYARNLKVFREWFGDEQPIDLITSAKLEEYWAFLSLKISEHVYAPSYCRNLFMTAKQFISRLAELGLIPLPGNIRSRRLCFRDGPKQIVTFTDDEVRQLLKACDGFSDRTRLYLLLMLNCGMYQSDISDLGADEVDWTEGILTRKRSKHRHRKNAPVVRYRLWPETLELLRRFRAKEKVLNEQGQPRVLLSEDGNPLVKYREDTGNRQYDSIASAYSRLLERVDVKKPLKAFRKTGATKLGEHKEYKFYQTYFLANSPRGVTERHYAAPSDAEFFAALDWLRCHWLE